jgi:hypothetical protein
MAWRWQGMCRGRCLSVYSNVRQEAKRDAVKVLSAKRPKKPTKADYDTNKDTKPAQGEQVPAYVVEKMVGTRRFELLTSTVSNMHITVTY